MATAQIPNSQEHAKTNANRRSSVHHRELLKYLCQLVNVGHWQSACTSDRKKSPTLVHGVSSPFLIRSRSSISSSYISTAGIMCSAIGLWPARYPTEYKTLITRVKMGKNRLLNLLLHQVTWTAEPVGYKGRSFINSLGLVLFSEGLWVQEAIVPGQTKHWVLLRWAVDVSRTYLCDGIT